MDIMYYLVYIPETDGDLVTEPYNDKRDLDERVKELCLHRGDYAIFHGSCIKGFH